MTHHSKTLPALASALLLTFLATACSSPSPAARQLPFHPTGEARISDKPRPGYVPTNVWRVTGHSGNTIYLAGTCHSIPDHDIPFPSSYYAAYQDSRDVFLEVDDASLSVKLMTLGALPSMFSFFADHHDEFIDPKGRKLSDSLSPKTDKLLRAHYGSGYAEKQNFTPLGLLFTHQFMDDSGPDQGGVDDYFNLVAHRDHKKIRSLDDHSVVDAIKPVLELTLEESRQEIAAKGVDAAVKETILQNDPADSDWRYGKVDKTTHAALAKMKKDHPETYQMLLPRRNRQWMTAITRALEGKQRTAILVGALHLPGPDGLLELLRQQGYHPQQMYGIDHPKPAAQSR